MRKPRIVKSTGYKNKPAWFHLVNGIWKSCYFLGAKVKIEKDHLISLARKQTGLQFLGEDFWEEPLDRLVDSINHEAELHPVGRYIAQKRITSLLETRLRAEMWFRKKPEILDQELYPVNLICGLQRTGTTKLQRLLAADPDHRVLLSWEAINPFPLDGVNRDIEQRKRAARVSEKALRMISPGFFSIHPVEYEKPEEDILLLDVTFLSTTPEAIMHVPSYAAWLEKTDQKDAYTYAVKLMKFLQYQRPAKKWLLKSPHHMEFLDLAHKHFGKVHFIWTHRNMLESLPSFLSMVAHSQAIFSNRVSLDNVARHWVRKTAYMLEKGIEFRQAHPGEQFTDVYYENLVESPMKVLEEIYRNGNVITPDLRQKFLETDKRNTANRYGVHVYHPEDFGLSTTMLNDRFNHYTEFLKTIGR